MSGEIMRLPGIGPSTARLLWDAFSYFEAMQKRITDFVCANSSISPERFSQLMMNTGELVLDMGTVIDGETAVKEGRIDRLGSLSDAIEALYGLIETSEPRYPDSTPEK